MPPKIIPFTDGMELGLGFDDLTGAVRSLAAIDFDAPGAAAEDLGMTGHYDTSLVRTAEELYESLGVSVAAEGRYGLFSASAKVDFAESSRFSSTATPGGIGESPGVTVMVVSRAGGRRAGRTRCRATPG